MNIEPKYCNVSDCEASFMPHYWGRIAAYDKGWMIQKDGVAWCPDHLPYWVAGYRQKVARLKRDSVDDAAG